MLYILANKTHIFTSITAWLNMTDQLAPTTVNDFCLAFAQARRLSSSNKINARQTFIRATCSKKKPCDVSSTHFIAKRQIYEVNFKLEIIVYSARDYMDENIRGILFVYPDEECMRVEISCFFDWLKLQRTTRLSR